MKNSIQIEFAFDVELSIEFTNITNMEVMIVSGGNLDSAYTSFPDVKEGDIVHVPIYNISYIIAVPIVGANQTRIAFDAKI